jgi:VanZ family protein
MSSATSLLALYTAVLTVGLLAPFDFYTRNGVTWDRGADAVVFNGPGILRSRGSTGRLYAELTSGSGLTVELRGASHATDQSGPARIVSYSADTGSRNFTVAQEGSALVVRLRTPETGENGTPGFNVPEAFAPGAWRQIVVTYDFRALCAYVDGRRRVCRSSPAGDFSNWDPTYELLIGNEATADRPWRGAISRVALYNRPLSEREVAKLREPLTGSRQTLVRDGLVALYEFTERSGSIIADSSARTGVPLAIPRVVEQVRPFLKQEIALARRPLRGADVLDAVLNLVVFLPFALLSSLALEARGRPPATAFVMAMVATAVFSFALESAQYFTVSRSSELQDVALNIVSGGLGGLLYLFGRRRRGAHSK